MGCFQIFGYVILFGFMSYLLGSWQAAVGLFLGLVAIVFVYRTLVDRSKKTRAEKMLAENIEWQVSDELASYIQEVAVALEGDGNYGFRVVGEQYRKEAFKELAEHLQVDKDETLSLQTQLVCQPNNPHDPKAVAVTLGGYLIGWIPRYAAGRLHDFLLPIGGVATVNTKISFKLQKEEFEVQLNLSEPYTKINIKPFEV